MPEENQSDDEIERVSEAVDEVSEALTKLRSTVEHALKKRTSVEGRDESETFASVAVRLRKVEDDLKSLIHMMLSPPQNGAA